MDQIGPSAVASQASNKRKRDGVSLQDELEANHPKRTFEGTRRSLDSSNPKNGGQDEQEEEGMVEQEYTELLALNEELKEELAIMTKVSTDMQSLDVLPSNSSEPHALHLSRNNAPFEAVNYRIPSAPQADSASKGASRAHASYIRDPEPSRQPETAHSSTLCRLETDGSEGVAELSPFPWLDSAIGAVLGALLSLSHQSGRSVEDILSHQGVLPLLLNVLHPPQDNVSISHLGASPSTEALLKDIIEKPVMHENPTNTDIFHML